MSHYPKQYLSSNGRLWNIEDMPDGHLQNAAAKLKAQLAEGWNDATVLAALELEITDRQIRKANAEAEA